MAGFRLSELARADLLGIAEFTFETWGEEQAYRYLGDLESCFERLARSPALGRTCDRICQGYRRFEHAKHIIFYRVDGEEIFISRILHQRMLPRRHLLEDTGPSPS